MAIRSSAMRACALWQTFVIRDQHFPWVDHAVENSGGNRTPLASWRLHGNGVPARNEARQQELPGYHSLVMGNKRRNIRLWFGGCRDDCLEHGDLRVILDGCRVLRRCCHGFLPG